MLQYLTPAGKLKNRTGLAHLGKEDLLRLYGAMLRVRLLDEKMLTLQRQGRIGFYGACTGQEAATIGSGYALAPQDWVFPALREGGVALLRGWPLRKLIAQILGNAADVLKGRQMPCHYSDSSVRQVSWSSCIGTQLPHAVGAAWGMKLRRDKSICIAYLGDGATSQSDFHVAMNFAGVFQLPVVFLCQNNQWSISVPLQRQTASSNLAVKAKAYGFEGVVVDGNDVLAVYQVTRKAVRKARAGKGPTFIEAFTYRMGAHSTSDDPSRYRDESVTEAWKGKDPILRFEKFLLQRGVLDEKAREALREEYSKEINETVRELEGEPDPPLESLFEDVYSELPWHLAEQRRELLGSESSS